MQLRMRHHLNHIVFIRRLRQVARKTLVAVLGERLACKFIDLLYRILEGAGAVVLKAVVPARQLNVFRTNRFSPSSLFLNQAPPN